MEPQQKRPAVLHAAARLAAWPASYQGAQASEDGGAVRGRPVGAAEDGEPGMFLKQHNYFHIFNADAHCLFQELENDFSFLFNKETYIGLSCELSKLC